MLLSHYKIQTPQRQLEMDFAPTLFQIEPEFEIAIFEAFWYKTVPS